MAAASAAANGGRSSDSRARHRTPDATYRRLLPGRSQCTSVASFPITAAGQFRTRTGFPLSVLRTRIAPEHTDVGWEYTAGLGGRRER